MSDMVGTVLSQKSRRLQRFRNESSFARSDAEQRPDHACRETIRDLGEDGGAKHVVERLSRDAVAIRRTFITYSKLLHDVSKLFT